jgi:hypothetical protein
VVGHVKRFRHVQILVDGNEESALAAYWISDGIDRCRVGFLQRHLLKQSKEYNGRIAQIVEFYKDSESPSKRKKNHRNLGCCKAVIIDTRREESDAKSPPARKRQRTTKEGKEGKTEVEKVEF